MTREDYNKASEHLQRVRNIIISQVPIGTRAGDMPPELLSAYQLTIALTNALDALVAPWD